MKFEDRRRWTLGFLLACGFACLSDPALAAPNVFPRIVISGESAGKGRRLAALNQLVKEERWADAVAGYLQLLAEESDELVPVDSDHSLPVRRLCHMAIAALPPQALALYREQADPLAKKLWDGYKSATLSQPAAPPSPSETGVEGKERTVLERLLDSYYCTRFGDRALNLLGDAAFERGDLDEAELWWNQLLGPDHAKSTAVWLTFPDARVNLAEVRAKRILLHRFRGDRQQFETELSAFTSTDADAKGHLAGMDGKLVDILRRLDLSDRVEGSGVRGQGSGRSAESVREPEALIFAGKPWSASLVNVFGWKQDPAVEKARVAGAPSVRPVIWEDMLLIADDYHVAAFDLRSGRPAGIYPEEEGFTRIVRSAGINPAARPVSLAVSEGRTYACLRQFPEALATGPGRANASIQEDSVIVCLEAPRSSDGKLNLCWKVSAREPNADLSVFEGSPVLANERIYVVRSVRSGAEIAKYVECLSAESGARLWRKLVCELHETGAPRFEAQPLVSAGPEIVYCSHAGVLVALDARTGTRSWACHYPSRLAPRPSAPVLPRDFVPGLFADGLLFIAPADLAGIRCLDPTTGGTVWESRPLQMSQLLCVSDGKLIVTTDSKPKGMRAFAVDTGKERREWIRPDDGAGELPSHGIAVSTCDRLYWPTEFGVRVLDRETGFPNPVDDDYISQRLGRRPGNLAVDHGFLAVVEAEKMTVYVPAAGVRR